ncbi:MAG TPA: MFS transporter, partial [Labilithrix sp.]
MAATPAKFPRTFYYANAIELFERLAHYGLYIGLSLYLTNVVHMTDVEVGFTLGNWRLVASLAPIPCGAIADRITFKRSLLVAFTLYAIAYTSLLLFPQKLVAILSLFLAAIAGGFMKPVIMGTVIRTSPPGRQTEGFGVFYRMINAGSVVGKTLAYGVRRLVALRFVATTSVIASLVALGIAAFGYQEPEEGKAEKGPAMREVLAGYATALKDLRFTAFLLVASGFYFMAEQFYMTFPKYVTRTIDEKAPLELITLINPACIAIAQGVVVRLMRNVGPIWTMSIGVAIGSVSMLVMGAVPTLAGACLSFFVFAVAEMILSPRYYEYVSSFAPKGREGLYMGLSIAPLGLGGLVGGVLSGRLIARYLPKDGPGAPLAVWGTYAAIGVGCSLLLAVYAI